MALGVTLGVCLESRPRALTLTEHSTKGVSRGPKIEGPRANESSREFFRFFSHHTTDISSSIHISRHGPHPVFVAAQKLAFDAKQHACGCFYFGAP